MEPGHKFLCFLLGLSCTISPTSSAKAGLNTISHWGQLEFEYPDKKTRECDIKDGIFQPGKPAPIDVDVYYPEGNEDKKVFVTIPRFQPGVPVTLGVVTDKKLNGNPVIAPYPSWEWHQDVHQCKKNRLISVFRVQIDECNRLWVIDTGTLINDQVCAPQILAFDLRTNQVVHQFDLKSPLVDAKSLPVTIVADVRDSRCDNTFVYVADCQSFDIIVHDVKEKHTWKVQDKSMYPDPAYGTFEVLGDSWDLMDGVLGMALSPYKPGQDRKLYYHAMSSGTENYIYTQHLRNHSLWASGDLLPQYFHTYPHSRNTQVAAEVIDKEGIMYFGLHKQVDLVCWNTGTDYGLNNFGLIDDDKTRLQFESGIKIRTPKSGKPELWLLTSRFQKVATGKINPHETNFRILAGKLSDLLFGSKCKTQRGAGGGGGGGHGYGLVGGYRRV